MCALVLPFAHSGIRVTFTDVARDPGWPDHYRDLSIRNGIRAAWSEPILTKDNHVFGTSARCQNGAVLLATLSFIVGAVVKFNPSGPRGMMCFPSRRTFVLLWLFGVIIAMPVENGLAQCAAIASTPRAASDCATHELSDEIIATIDPKHSYSLAELIDIAERNNPRTRIVWEQAKQKARQLGIERSSYYPVLAAMATFGDQRIIDPFPKPLAPLGYTVDEIPPAQPGITLEYLLFDFGKRKARIDAAKAAALAAGAIFIQANQEVAFAVASDFYKLVTAQERLQAAQETLKTAQTTQDAAEDRLQNGRATLPDVLNAWAETSEAVFDMESADGVEGPVLRLNVADHQRVASGDLLFEIDDRPYKYALDHATSDQAALEGQIVDEQRRIQAEVHAVDASGANTRNATANVDRAQASIREAEADVAHSQAALDRAKAEWTYAANNLHRVEPWLTKQFVTVDQVDQARTAERASDQALHEAESQLALSQAHLNSMRAELAQARASFEQSTAQHSFNNPSRVCLPSIHSWLNVRDAPQRSRAPNTTTTIPASMRHLMAG
jgi:hypothetical protein